MFIRFSAQCGQYTVTSRCLDILLLVKVKVGVSTCGCVCLLTTLFAFFSSFFILLLWFRLLFCSHSFWTELRNLSPWVWKVFLVTWPEEEKRNFFRFLFQPPSDSDRKRDSQGNMFSPVFAHSFCICSVITRSCVCLHVCVFVCEMKNDFKTLCFHIDTFDQLVFLYTNSFDSVCIGFW